MPRDGAGHKGDSAMKALELVAVKVVGICGSEVHGQDGNTGCGISPIIMGHEADSDIAQLISEYGVSPSEWP